MSVICASAAEKFSPLENVTGQHVPVLRWACITLKGVYVYTLYTVSQKKLPFKNVVWVL